MKNVVEFKKKIPLSWFYHELSPFQNEKQLEEYAKHFNIIFPPALILEFCGFNSFDSTADLIRLAHWLDIPVNNLKPHHIRSEILWGLKKKLSQHKINPTTKQYFTSDTFFLEAIDFCLIDEDTFPSFLSGNLVNREIIMCGLEPEYLHLVNKEIQVESLLDTLAVISRLRNGFLNLEKDPYLNLKWYQNWSIILGVNLKDGYSWKNDLTTNLECF